MLAQSAEGTVDADQVLIFQGGSLPLPNLAQYFLRNFLENPEGR